MCLTMKEISQLCLPFVSTSARRYFIELLSFYKWRQLFCEHVFNTKLTNAVQKRTWQTWGRTLQLLLQYVQYYYSTRMLSFAEQPERVSKKAQAYIVEGELNHNIFSGMLCGNLVNYLYQSHLKESVTAFSLTLTIYW